METNLAISPEIQKILNFVPTPAGRNCNPFREGQRVLVAWEGKRYEGAISFTTEDGPDVHVRLDENVGSRLENGHGVIVGWNSTDIQPSQ